MRRILLSFFALLSLSAESIAQTSDFESQTLLNNDTFYVNYSNPFNDAGFDDGSIHFPYVWDTAFGGSWSTGFAYSNKKNDSTSGYMNQYSAKPARGYNGSDKYAVYWAGYGEPRPVTIKYRQWFVPHGLYYTNSTYAYNSMRDGDFVAKKFGGTSGNDSDWFMVTAIGYLNGARKKDTVNFYLADFRFANNAQDYIVKDWRMVNLTPLGAVDSFKFILRSSDVGMFGMNTPAYFCLDNVTVGIPIVGLGKDLSASVAKVFPNPATDHLFVELKDASIKTASIYGMNGSLISAKDLTADKVEFNTSTFSPGMYLLKLEGPAGVASVRFIKQ